MDLEQKTDLELPLHPVGISLHFDLVLQLRPPATGAGSFFPSSWWQTRLDAKRAHHGGTNMEIPGKTEGPVRPM